MSEFERLHPRDRTGKWRRKGLEIAVTATPYRGAGKATGNDYRGTTRYKGFEHSMPDLAKEHGLTFSSLERTGGVWEGGAEPSAKTIVLGTKKQAIALMDAVGSRYNQDAVIAFISGDGGPSTRYLSTGNKRVTNGQVEKAITKVNKGKPEAEQIQGATVLSTGKLELLDTENNARQAIFELADELGLEFGYDVGEAFLRFKYEDYPDAQGHWKTEQARGPQEGLGEEPEILADGGEGSSAERGSPGDVYQALEVPCEEVPLVTRHL